MTNNGPAGARTREFGPNPGSTKMWFGKFENKTFDEVPSDYRRWLVERSATNKSSNLVKFKRLCDEYNAWLAQNKRSTTKNDTERVPAKSLTNQSHPGNNTKRKRPDVDDSNVVHPRGIAILKIDWPPKSGQPSAGTVPKTEGNTEQQVQQDTPRLKQTTLSFARPALGSKTPNISTLQLGSSSVISSKSNIQRNPQVPVTPSRRPIQRNEANIRSLLSTSKSDRTRDMLPAKMPANPKQPSPPSGPEKQKISEAKESALVSPPPKRRRTIHEVERVPDDVSSSQSSVHSPWRPLDLDSIRF